MKITAKQYAQILYDLTDGKSKPEVETSVADFARYLRDERKLKLAEKIVEHFGAIYNKKRGVVEADVATAEKMNEPMVKKVKHFLKDKYQAKEVVIQNTVDKNIKGGILIKVGDEVIDGSINGKLTRLRIELST